MQPMDSSYPPALPSDAWLGAMADAIGKMADALSALAQAAADCLVSAWRPVQQAMDSYWRQYIKPWIAEMAPVIAEMKAATASDMAIERALRDYAAWYNARHPHKRIAWHRMNRRQVAIAILEYLEPLPS